MEASMLIQKKHQDRATFINYFKGARFVVVSTFTLTFVEVLATMALKRGVELESKEYFAGGVLLFALLGLCLGWSISEVGHMNMVNAMWQSFSIASISLVSVFYFKESITRRQMFGVCCAIIASLCFA